MPDVGTLQVSLVSNRGKRPITDAAVEISSAGEPDKILEVLKTDLSGQTEVIELETPPLEYSMEPGLNQPYSEYNLKITAPGFLVDNLHIMCAGRLQELHTKPFL